MIHRTRTAWSIAVLVVMSMVAGAYLWQGPRAALLTAVGSVVAAVGLFVTWSRALNLPSSPRDSKREPPSRNRHTTEQPPPPS
jgi:hypothetical protein